MGSRQRRSERRRSPHTDPTPTPRRPTVHIRDSTGSREAERGPPRQAQGFAPGSRPSDEAIEIGLRRRAVESAKDAEVLLRWLSRPRSSPSGLGLEEIGDEELEGLYAGLLRLARLDEDELARLASSS